MDQFLLFGDSITQQSLSPERGSAFGAALANAYIRRLDLVNRGLSGYNSQQALAVLPQAVPSPSCASLRFVSIFFGANDSRLPDSLGGPPQHVPLRQFSENIRALVSHPSILAHHARIVLITPPPFDERLSLESAAKKYPGEATSLNRRSAVTAQYARAACDAGKAIGVAVLNLWEIMITKAGGDVNDPKPVGSLDKPANMILQSFLHDGLHLSTAGYDLLYEEMMALIARVWPDQTPEKLPFVLPAWDDPKVWDPQTPL